MRLLLLTASLPLVLTVVTHAYSQTDLEKASPPAWELRNATPGVGLTLQELRRWTKGPKHGVDYRLVVSGLPKEKIFKLWQKNLGREPEFAFLTVYLDSSGDLVFEGSDRKFKQIALSLSDFAKGEPIEYALISTDQTMRAFTRVVPFPIEAKEGQCRLSVQLGSRRGDLFAVIGEGFAPSEDVTTDSRSNGEVLPGKIQTSPDGKFFVILAPAVVGKQGGTASYTVTGNSCTVTVSYEWGPSALKLQ